MSREQYDWLDRKGVSDVYMLTYLKQDDKYVYLWRDDIRLLIKRKKDMIGWTF
jgi:hypothetical protein